MGDGLLLVIFSWSADRKSFQVPLNLGFKIKSYHMWNCQVPLNLGFKIKSYHMWNCQVPLNLGFKIKSYHMWNCHVMLICSKRNSNSSSSGGDGTVLVVAAVVMVTVVVLAVRVVGVFTVVVVVVAPAVVVALVEVAAGIVTAGCSLEYSSHKRVWRQQNPAKWEQRWVRRQTSSAEPTKTPSSQPWRGISQQLLKRVKKWCTSGQTSWQNWWTPTR